jgi:hypothetical protein
MPEDKYADMSNKTKAHENKHRKPVCWCVQSLAFPRTTKGISGTFVYIKERGFTMRNAALACFLILIPCSLCAQDKKVDWKALYGLRSGEKIELVETGMKKHVGTFSTVTEEAIQMREGSADIGIPKENVARVTVLDKSYRLRNAFLLGVVGAGAGAGIAAAASRCPNSTNTFNLCGLGRSAEIAIGSVVGLAGGAGIGAEIPSHPTIYRAEPAKPNAPH